MSKEWVKATVQNTIKDGDHGPFAVATADDGSIPGSITFSLEPTVWQELEWPEQGMSVFLEKLREKRAGWRAKLARFWKPSDEQTERSSAMSDNAEQEIRSILSPLEKFKSDARRDSKEIHMGGFKSDHPELVMSHADYIRLEVLPRKMKSAVWWFGMPTVAKELVEVALPAYDRISAEEMGCFWGYTIEGKDEFESATKSNNELADDIGVKRLFSPIIELALVHEKTQVFSGTAKFFSTHACRLGRVLTRFPYDDFLTYIKLSKRLLQAGVFDWSIENSGKDWDLLAPAIKKYGFQTIIGAITETITRASYIPGLRDSKYKYSHLTMLIKPLYPYMVARSMESDKEKFSDTLRQIFDLVTDLHEAGALRKEFGMSLYRKEGHFFQAFKGYVPVIESDGLDKTIGPIKEHWAPILSNKNIK